MPAPEKEIIRRIRRLAEPVRQSRAFDGVVLGIGDDCAVLRPNPGQEILITTDFSLEGTHFRREWHPAESVGHRCLCRGLSDIAAMSGKPTAAFLSLALPKRLPQKWVDGFLRGFMDLAKRYEVGLAGGDIAESRAGVLADVVVMGTVPRGKAIQRFGARSGDIVYVTGRLGGSAAVLKRLFAGKPVNPKSAPEHFYPEPRVAVGEFLRKYNLATAMIDLSDGLSTDLAHICDESGVGATLLEPLIPIACGTTLDQALHGGEDYELLFTARNSARVPLSIVGVPMTEIGWITKEKKILITDGTKAPRRLNALGWEHFKKKGL